MPPLATVPIGKPICNIKLYVLDRYHNLLPVGVPGELYIGGVGVARGYLHQPELSSEKFIPSPFGGSGKLYKTGDIAKVLGTGDIDYLGRIDNQVKIRGMRIELGEIENLLQRHADIDEAVVLAIDPGNGDKKLCCFYRSQKEISAKELTMYLSGTLPGYMIPSYFYHIDVFPVNRNGKLDRSRLPQPGAQLRLQERTAPRNATEELIANAWASVLHLPAVGIDEDFFELGGDSLSAVKVVSMLRLGVSIMDFYACPTIRQLAEKLATDNVKPGLLINMSRNYDAANSSVICFPYGGGSALSFRELSESSFRKNLKLNIFGVNLPGHDYGTRDELEPFDKTAAELAEEIKSNVPGDLVLYGHCAGSALLMAVARILEATGVSVKAVFIGALLPPRNKWVFRQLNKPRRGYSEKYVAGYLRQAGLPEDMLTDRNYLQYMSKVLAYDQDNLGSFLCQTDDKKRLNIPMYAVVGDEDPATRLHGSRYHRWRMYFNDVRLIVLNNAGHFFINSHVDQLIECLSEI
jgi:surfactin synthase thioesterase subunit